MIRSSIAPSLCLTTLLWALAEARADWPAFRGPTGMGVSAERGLPVKWGPEENVLWKTKLPGPGISSPIVWGERVFVTCYSGYGTTPADKGELAKLRRHLLCVDRKTGKVLWQKDVAAKLPENDFTGPLLQHGYASSTPVTDGERVYVFFGRTGVFAFDFSGKELWSADVGEGINTFGSGASPILYHNLLLVNATVESQSFLALDKKTGKEVWRVKEIGDCWATPLMIDVGGKPEVVLSTHDIIRGFEPRTGKELWQCDCVGPDYTSATPVARGGLVYVMGSGMNGRLFMAVRAGGQGDVTKTHVVWSREKIGASYCSPVLAGDHLFYVSTLFTCLRADTGAVVVQERLAGVGLEYSSPVLAEGKLFVFTRKGVAHVLAAKDKLEPIAQNDLGDPSGFSASPAVSRGQFFIRSNQYLYCLGK